MSNFLGFESFLVPLGASIDDVKNTLKAALTSRGYRAISESLQVSAALKSAGWDTGNAFDGDCSTSVSVALASLPQYLGVQAPVGFTPTILRIHAHPANNLSTGPKGWTIDYSDDGSTWTPHQTISNEIRWAPGEKRQYAITGASSRRYWRINITDGNGSGTLFISNVIFENAVGQQLVDGKYFVDVIPPVSEAIGNSMAFEFLRIRFTGSDIKFYPLKSYKVGFPQFAAFHFDNTAAGTATLSITINGRTVSYTGSTGASAVENINKFYDTIRASVDSEIMGWNWRISSGSTQNSNDGNYYLYAESKTVEATKVITTSATVFSRVGGSVQSGWVQDEVLQRGTLPSIGIDLISGFVYYMQISSRGIALATKTNIGFYGPLHACWADNAAALQYLPTNAPRCSPVELVCGYDEDSNNLDSMAFVSAPWCLSGWTFAGLDIRGDSSSHGFVDRVVRRHEFYDAYLNNYGNDAYSNTYIKLSGSGIFVDDQFVGNDFQVHRAKTLGHRSFDIHTSSPYGYGQDCGINPGIEISDWYKFRGTATNESLVLIADSVIKTGLASDFNIGDATVNLVDASLFQSSGFAVIGIETIQYTGKSGNTLTGVTHGRYGTIAYKHWTGDSIAQGSWFVVMNGGALFAGYNKPS
jgi:hypothetical protein